MVESVCADAKNGGWGARPRIDCNTGRGSFEIEAGKLKFGSIVSTRMACPPGSLDGVFSRDLQRVVSFFLSDGWLCLELH